ncbi:hypothetical protein [Natronococcus wangiae]|uniref:hypothetical protein n=1 Tax=Natronococcus wangiae TaxID=3068275 RepID=UPI00273DADCF|nr:hypothetical protein [Natronococcus sp. AD5]
MQSEDEIRDRLQDLRRIARACDYYDPYATYLRGEIAALEWALAESDPPAYDHVPTTDDAR